MKERQCPTIEAGDGPPENLANTGLLVATLVSNGAEVIDVNLVRCCLPLAASTLKFACRFLRDRLFLRDGEFHAH